MLRSRVSFGQDQKYISIDLSVKCIKCANLHWSVTVNLVLKTTSYKDHLAVYRDHSRLVYCPL